MADAEFTIPENLLPEGFARTLGSPPEEPVEPRPAATIVLMREGPEGGEEEGLEILLLRRVRSAGFVPGAWVFPGGRVDGDDATPPLLERLEGLAPPDAARRLGLHEDAEPPAVAYYVAAIREAFEETGILVGRDADGAPAPSITRRPEVRTLRDELLADEDRFPSVLDRMSCRMDGGAVAYVAHWITPLVEPRRYDTRFFAAAVSREQEVALAEAELTDHAWLTPAAALRRREEGTLPMVFPTIKTLQALAAFDSPAEALAAFEERSIPTILPRLVRTPTGVGIEMDEDEG